MKNGTDSYNTMLSAAEGMSRLKGHGERMTAQRRAVLEIMENNTTHPTAEAVIGQVRSRLGCVCTATIYNTLDTLEEVGLIRRIEGLEQRAHFDPDTSRHQHAVCRHCGQVWDVDFTEATANLPEGFTMHDAVIHGHCVDCG